RGEGRRETSTCAESIGDRRALGESAAAAACHEVVVHISHLLRRSFPYFSERDKSWPILPRQPSQAIGFGLRKTATAAEVPRIAVVVSQVSRGRRPTRILPWLLPTVIFPAKAPKGIIVKSAGSRCETWGGL